MLTCCMQLCLVPLTVFCTVPLNLLSSNAHILHSAQPLQLDICIQPGRDSSTDSFPSCSKLQSSKRQRLGDNSSEWGLVWQWTWQPGQGDVDTLTEEERSLLFGPLPTIRKHSHVQIREFQFRTAGAEINMQTQDSGVAAVFTRGEQSRLEVGILQGIWDVRFGAQPKILLDVLWYRRHIPDSRFSCTSLVQVEHVPGGTFHDGAESLIEAPQVTAQVFFTADPDKPRHKHVFRLQSSAFQAPQHLIANDGSLLSF